MIQESDIKQFCPTFDLSSNRFVSLAWFEITAMVIMSKDNLVCICLKGILENNLLVNYGPTSPTFE